MPAFNIWLPYFTPGDLIRGFGEWYFGGYDPRYLTPPTIVLGVTGGCRSIIVPTPDDPEFDTYTYHFILMSLPGEATAPARWFLDSSGFNSSTLIRRYLGMPTLSYWIDQWIEVLIGIKQLIIEEWTDGVVGESHGAEASGFLGLFVSGSSNFEVITPMECLVTYDQAQVYNIAYEGWHIESTFAAAPIAGSPLGVSVGLDVSPIVKVLQEILLMDVDISFNHGQFAFSVRGKANVG